jgi:hypothetical protein
MILTMIALDLAAAHAGLSSSSIRFMQEVFGGRVPVLECRIGDAGSLTSGPEISGVAFARSHGLTLPLRDGPLRMARDPIGQRRLRAHHAGHGRDVTVQQAAFFAGGGIGAQARDKKQFEHVNLVTSPSLAPYYCRHLVKFSLSWRANVPQS